MNGRSSPEGEPRQGPAAKQDQPQVTRYEVAGSGPFSVAFEALMHQMADETAQVAAELLNEAGDHPEAPVEVAELVRLYGGCPVRC